MIVRVLEDGQYEVPDSEVAGLEGLDSALDKALAAHDDAEFKRALSALLAHVRTVGRPVADDRIVSSDLAVPAEYMSMAEVEAFLTSEEGAN